MNATNRPAADLNTDGVIIIDTPERAQSLAAKLLDPNRPIPVVVVSTRPGVSSHIDAQQVYDHVVGIAAVAVIPNGWIAWEFTSHMPDGTQVYGDAGRIYPTGTRWTRDPRECPLQLAGNPQQARHATRELAQQALTMGYHCQPTITCNCVRSRQLEAEIRELHATNRRLAAQLAPVPNQGRTATKAAQTSAEHAEDDPLVRIRAEIARQAQQRHPDHELPGSYEVTAQFLNDLTALAASKYRKAAAVTAEILTGLALRIPARQIHAQRTGQGGNNPPQRTPDGLIIWRTAVETHTPAALRIHWANTPTGIRLLSITTHDQAIAA